MVVFSTTILSVVEDTDCQGWNGNVFVTRDAGSRRSDFLNILSRRPKNTLEIAVGKLTRLMRIRVNQR